MLPTKEKAIELLHEHIKEDYQILHSKMVAAGLEAYANKFNLDSDLWYITGLLHDLDYYEFPEQHPWESVKWFEQWGYPEELIHAVKAHSPDKPRVKPENQLAKTLIAVDEMAGLLYAYSLMRPTGFEGMEAKGAKKRFKDKAFAAKIDRDEITYGVTELGVDMGEHIALLINTFKLMPEFQNK